MVADTRESARGCLDLAGKVIASALADDARYLHDPDFEFWVDLCGCDVESIRRECLRILDGQVRRLVPGDGDADL